MYLDAAKKQEIFEKYGKSNTDTGSAEAQIALFSYPSPNPIIPKISKYDIKPP